MTAEEEHRIRERAYFMWEQEGRPRGRELDHRLRAEAEIAGERLRGSITALTDTAPDANIPPARDRSGANGYAGQHDRTEKRSQRQRQARGDDRERLASARQAAEALFTSKGQRTTG